MRLQYLAVDASVCKDMLSRDKNERKVARELATIGVLILCLTLIDIFLMLMSTFLGIPPACRFLIIGILDCLAAYAALRFTGRSFGTATAAAVIATTIVVGLLLVIGVLQQSELAS